VLRCLPATSRHEERRRSIQWSHCEQSRSGPPSSRQYLGCRASLLNRDRTSQLTPDLDPSTHRFRLLFESRLIVAQTVELSRFLS
jgi:hypothetical protein